jgi:hypothetical protein
LDEVCKVIDMGCFSGRLNFGSTRIRALTDTNSGGLFAEYVKMFLKRKQESSGYPSWVQSEKDNQKYIEEYRLAEGIALDKASVSKNAGQRNLAKLKLNSMWGKWAQNQNNCQLWESFTIL